MTVTQRRNRADPDKSDTRLPAEPGIKYTCDFCSSDITHTVRIHCAALECEEVDLCVSCFLEGREGLRHKNDHPYKIVEQHAYPIFTEDWGADEELLLISGLITNGLGNWAEVAAHVGTRTKEECEKHYWTVYLGVGEDGRDLHDGWRDEGVDMEIEQEEGPKRKKRRREFMPPMDRTFDIDPDVFLARKKERIEELRKPHAIPAGTNLAPMVSAPTNHEIAGYMPGRLEFEHELENDAEMVVKDMEFGLVFKYGGDEQPAAKITRLPDAEDQGGEGQHTGLKQHGESEVQVKQEPPDEIQSESVVDDVEDEDELEVKLALLNIYFSKLDKREEAKDFIFTRGLTEHKKIQAQERKRPKDERELVQRYKAFAKMQTSQDYELFIEGLLFEHLLRKRIAELQEYRRMGITTALEAEAYDSAKAARAGYRPLAPRQDVLSLPTGARINAGQHRFLHGTPPPGVDPLKRGPQLDHTRGPPGNVRRSAPLNLANAASLDLLSTEEQSLCSSLRVLPKPYLTIKEMYIRENERRKGQLKRRDARRMMKIDVNKSGRIFDFLVSSGMLILAYDPSKRNLRARVEAVNGLSWGDEVKRDDVIIGEILNGEAG
ncbi:hypothetical protein TREMEDRAFT_31549 [Tremella mesenterica DSM 1558]|uniref:uncharacterized protein n=1 Tax=Tremella mesenterica (strain ATCC 24925 / CBS 8224 / DSM 1558 / NBRC 9311 / NRRL Y-6157 / RJB 2259-6 / UBC 559-6) TaxID=578456 RepID=UPI0003F492CC|nr:uncharacterized protein TREMEDRAFT_31549 [Tremella mesenterica DSM 1558]EIW68866.1 hypothetical protein TREMEDRAFT_31549 [Tremella mesenterica DSM 1558]